MEMFIAIRKMIVLLFLKILILHRSSYSVVCAKTNFKCRVFVLVNLKEKENKVI